MFHAPTWTTARTTGKKLGFFGSFRTWGLYHKWEWKSHRPSASGIENSSSWSFGLTFRPSASIPAIMTTPEDFLLPRLSADGISTVIWLGNEAKAHAKIEGYFLTESPYINIC